MRSLRSSAARPLNVFTSILTATTTRSALSAPVTNRSQRFVKLILREASLHLRPPTNAMLDPTTLHRHFPALKDDFIFADNAGGSQCLQGCVDNVVDYLLKSNVQMGVRLCSYQSIKITGPGH